MVALERGRPATVRTPGGTVVADKVVLALSAWAGQVRELRRTMMPVAGHIVVTAPVGDRLSGTRFEQGELLGDSRLTVHYAQMTPAGRVVFGRGGGAVGMYGRVGTRLFDDPAMIATVTRDLHRWFPSLADVPITHSWGGPVDRAPRHLPFVGTIGHRQNIYYGHGYSGNGVAASAYIGRILGRLALEMNDEYTNSPLAQGAPAYLPPEPLRSVGAAVVRAAATHADDDEEQGRRPDLLTRSLRRLVHASTPRLLERRLRGGSREPAARGDSADGQQP
jgi:glycine/D-amino acid oxidase-like deaminating enzyme